MAKKQPKIKLDCKLIVVDVHKIKPSPYQVRKFFDEGKKKGLAQSIQQDGLIHPIMIRRNNGSPEMIAGERRVQAIRDYTEIKAVPAQVVQAGDLKARRMSAAENFQREDLTAIESVEAIVELVDVDLIEDAQLIEDKQYASMGKSPADRVKALLGKLNAMGRIKERGYKPSRELIDTAHNFVRRVEEIFKNLPKPVEWLSFLNNDLPILMDISEEVREVSNQNHLNRAQTRALKKLKDVSPE